ncbi:hypothetical protein SAMN04487898_12933 [Pedobacter sp. ok626]|uniref:hypothetical protein n=1 Tax=Pedobacter sp. ok626 TaxID=1761882 RepID=UPI000885DCC8|nr:hypothetical protein [Pedobacter sp. ok626]SDL93051.1 hypothetical protein SAMN04487898_12933 [Pedobacter sp. ok626]
MSFLRLIFAAFKYDAFKGRRNTDYSNGKQSASGKAAGISYSRFEASAYGFMYFSIDKNRLNVQAIDDSGKVIYESTLSKR